jgi:hypothetical protein
MGVPRTSNIYTTMQVGFPVVSELIHYVPPNIAIYVYASLGLENSPQLQTENGNPCVPISQEHRGGRAPCTGVVSDSVSAWDRVLGSRTT